MEFTAWEQRRHIERQYHTALKRLIHFCLSLINEGDGPFTIERKLRRLADSGALNSWSYRVAKAMVTNTLEENARTWRQAAATAGQGRQMFEIQRQLFASPVGVQVNELIARNAQYIKTVPQDVAKDLVRFTGTQAFADNRSSYKTDDFRRMIGDMTENHAKLISRTETAKAHSALVQAQAEDTGHQFYVWHAAHDVRVRPSHKNMDDVICRWDDPPHPESIIGEKDSGGYSPGNIYNCRCYSAPVILWRTIQWPHRVHVDGSIIAMSQKEFFGHFGAEALGPKWV